MKIYPFDKPTEKQIEYGQYLQSYIQDDTSITHMSKDELSSYIKFIKQQAEEVMDELRGHVDDIW
ncbi:hypothetical protein MCT67_000260 [Staphylococcus pseudintermedius]|nr:hypothetical protein [Staphylococcus pseudintermedius]EGQ3673043.1 hypothetical protein [Staphylococcus pseudintermedius]EIW3383803.1 hypothetical protein [Staphylococcus pseudintermedius]MDF0338635.1 hypothetical protein [Staphylococcus pseudintermedius]MDF0347851.1 hypothetical protein [Staphylococcus pseudintermedius]